MKFYVLCHFAKMAGEEDPDTRKVSEVPQDPASNMEVSEERGARLTDLCSRPMCFKKTHETLSLQEGFQAYPHF